MVHSWRSANPKWARLCHVVRAVRNLFFYKRDAVESHVSDVSFISLGRMFACIATILQEIEGVAVKRYRPLN